MNRLEELGLPDLPESLPAACIDAHTHMDAVSQMSSLSVEDNLAAAHAVNITRVVQIGCDLEDSIFAEQCAAAHSQVIAAVALHPNTAARLSDDHYEKHLDAIASLAQKGGHVRAIGETGLDRFRTRDEDQIVRQKDSFRRHIDMAHHYNLTLAIHDRDAHDEVIEILDEVGWPSRVIFHCFSGDIDFAKICLDHGAYLSFAGNVTYRANHHLQQAACYAPADRILTETDAPYLTPLPYRGRPNASYLMAHTVRFLNEIRHSDLEELCVQLSHNAEAAYGGSWG